MNIPAQMRSAPESDNVLATFRAVKLPRGRSRKNTENAKPTRPAATASATPAATHRRDTGQRAHTILQRAMEQRGLLTRLGVLGGELPG